MFEIKIHTEKYVHAANSRERANTYIHCTVDDFNCDEKIFLFVASIKHPFALQ